ncbi:MAG: hypothetical protein AB1656_06010 [Candidatus Omnitrophota bacterium]
MKRIRSFFLSLALIGGLTADGASRDDYRIAILLDDLPNHHPEIALHLASLLLDKGYGLRTIGVRELLNSSVVNAANFDLLVLPSAGSLPAQSVDIIENYIAQGGDVFALGAPAFSDWLWNNGGQWFSESSWRERLSKASAERMLFNFEEEDLNQWERNTNTPDSPFAKELAEGIEGNGLHVRIENMAGWDGLASPLVTNPFLYGESLTVFYVKGTKETRALNLEWVERDGSRWIAVFPVADEWRKVVLAPSDFHYWQSTPERGKPGDVFQPQNAVRLKIGAAWTHTGSRGGEYEFFIDEIGTAYNPLGDKPLASHTPPPIEGLSPSYKFYPITEAAQLMRRELVSLEEMSLPLPASMSAHHPRPTGKGFNKKRGWRWIPLLDAIGSRREWRGAPASMFVDFQKPNRFSIRASYSINDPDWHQEDAVLQSITSSINRMANGIFFEEAGSEFFTYRRGRPVVIGARAANLSAQDAKDLTLRFELKIKGDKRPVKRIIQSIDIPAGAIFSASHTVRLPKRDGDFELTVRLFHGDSLLDEIEHDLFVYRPKSETLQRFVSAHKGDFYLDGKKWYVHGVNYMPSTGIAAEDGPYYEQWLGSRSYDPEFIQRDLERCRDMGFNSISIFLYYQSLYADNLLDILRRCDNLGLKVNLSLRPGSPMDYNLEWWEEMIRFNRLWECDAIYAYDIAWEPFFGTEEQRRKYDPDWRLWIARKYGALEAAEKAWEFPAPKIDGNLTSPSARLLGQDGPHRKMIADYRRFADELIQFKYKAAADRIRALDPNHLISFRMTVTGDPTFLGDKNMPYDFPGVAICMDFMAPEGYGRIGDWERVKPGQFTVSYARCCAPGKPVIWAEAGVQAWDNQKMQTDPEPLEFQGKYFADFYKMVLNSYSNGVVWWWYPGGFRVGENSDFGIINPDGTDRPATRVIRQFAAQVLAERTIPKPNVEIEIDRDADARGLYGLYDQVKKDYWEAVESGKWPGLRFKTKP